MVVKTFRFNDLNESSSFTSKFGKIGITKRLGRTNVLDIVSFMMLSIRLLMPGISKALAISVKSKSISFNFNFHQK